MVASTPGFRGMAGTAGTRGSSRTAGSTSNGARLGGRTAPPMPSASVATSQRRPPPKDVIAGAQAASQASTSSSGKQYSSSSFRNTAHRRARVRARHIYYQNIDNVCLNSNNPSNEKQALLSNTNIHPLRPTKTAL